MTSTQLGTAEKNVLLHRLKETELKEQHFESLDILEQLLQLTDESHQERPNWLFKKGQLETQLGKIESALVSFQQCQPWRSVLPFLDLNHGHAYKALGQSARAATLYKQLVKDYNQYAGVAYWSLADLKDRKLEEAELADIERLMQHDLSLGNRALLQFALAKGKERAGELEAAMTLLNNGNSVIAQHRPFAAAPYADIIKQLTIAVRQPQMPATEQAANKDHEKTLQPIFIVGMPRSGSTLLEQILAAHSGVQTTDELPFIERLAIDIQQHGGYPVMLSRLTQEQKYKLRDKYISQVEQYFSGSSGCFIDKNPNNFIHIGLIKTIFPHAKIVNVMRDPLDNAMAVYKQYFANGHNYSYDLKQTAFYWQGYLHLMKHWQSVYGDSIYHVSYDQLTKEPDNGIRDLLEYCDLPFEQDCLQFYQSDRVVLTPSVSQVRQPINRRSIGSSDRYLPYIETSVIGLFDKIRSQMNAFLAEVV